MKIVTSATPEFLPGVIALRNSVEANFPEAELHCFFYSKGQTDFELPERVTFIHEASHRGPLTDEGKKFRHGLPLGPDMYARILIPEYFTGKVFYVDADCLVLNSLKEAWELDMGAHFSACVFRPDIGWHGGNRHDDMASGTFLCDCEKWNEIGLVDEIYSVMDKNSKGQLKRSFGLNVESVLSYVHNGNFLHLDSGYQNLTYYNSLIQSDKIAHFAGPKPWLIKGHHMGARGVYYKDLWEAYFDNNIDKARAIQSNLPTIRKINQFERKKPYQLKRR